MKRTMNMLLAACLMIPAVSFAGANPAAPRRSRGLDRAALSFGRKLVSSMWGMGGLSLLFATMFYWKPIRKAMASKPHARAANIKLVRNKIQGDIKEKKSWFKSLFSFGDIFAEEAAEIDNDPEFN